MLILSAGPTSIARNTLEAMGVQKLNADLSPEFYDQYQRVVEKYNQLIQNKTGFSFIMGAEAMIALEGACASLIEPNDQVLVFANGIFGRGFSDLISMYQGKPIMIHQPDDQGFPLQVVKDAVLEHPNAKIAVMVHCETPTGVTNHVSEIAQFLHEKNIISVVDSVSAIGGEELNYEESKIDVLLGGSQKCLSAPSGLGFVTLSKKAIEVIQTRKHPIASFYANYSYFLNWQEKMWFPYTMPEQLINAMEVALDNILAMEPIKIHAHYAEIVREVLRKNEVKLFAESELSNTLTAFYTPENISPKQILDELQEKHGILISGSLDKYQNSLLRIGHMGENNKVENFAKLFIAMDQVWKDLAIGESHFSECYQELVSNN